jgi:mannobiose 2-epimerase
LAKVQVDSFWDKENGGWHWKLAYGQVFAIYAMAEYYRNTGDSRGLEYAERTFELLQIHAADTLHGGYFENMEQDWAISAAGYPGGDRKSLDIHMHVMEAFTVLAQCTGKAVHLRKLEEVTQLLLAHMIDRENGRGRNQFDPSFRPIPPIVINRTWNAERQTGEVAEEVLESTSYGHNLELAWLMNRAGEALGSAFDAYDMMNRSLLDHSLRHGYDYTYGGVFRDGPPNGPAFVRDKEFWQNAEVLVGYLDGFEHFGDIRYWEAFEGTWRFVTTYMINHELGEWRQLLNRDGSVLVGDLGNPWKACYHSGRSVLESIIRLNKLLQTE